MSGKNKTMLYLIPHIGDELLSIGIDMCTSVKKGYVVHVALCTDGSNSITEGEEKQAIEKAFINSCHTLGVKLSHIHIPQKREAVDAFTVTGGERLIKRFLESCGNDTVICTFPPTGDKSQHRDHKALGRAAQNLLNQGCIKEVRFFITPKLYAKVSENPEILPIYPAVKKAPADVQEKIKSAMSSYAPFSMDFDTSAAAMCSYYYILHNEKQMTPLQRLNFGHKKWLKFQKQPQLYYSAVKCDCPDLGVLRLVSFFPNQVEEYKSFCLANNLRKMDKGIERLSDGSSFWCLISEDNNVVSSGWLAYKQHFYIGETDFGFDMTRSQTAILYDFQTEPQYRGKGYYGLLLRSILHHSPTPKRFIIYTSPENSASSKGILKAGFVFDGVYLGTNKSLGQYLKKENFTSIMRKNRFWGLYGIK